MLPLPHNHIFFNPVTVSKTGQLFAALFCTDGDAPPSGKETQMNEEMLSKTVLFKGLSRKETHDVKSSINLVGVYTGSGALL